MSLGTHQGQVTAASEGHVHRPPPSLLPPQPHRHQQTSSECKARVTTLMRIKKRKARAGTRAVAPPC